MVHAGSNPGLGPLPNQDGLGSDTNNLFSGTLVMVGLIVFLVVVDKRLIGLRKEEQPSKGEKHGVILISSTTGNGDPPENASRFVRHVKRRETAESKPFRHCAFAVLGLGDTNYDQFCATGKLLDKKMAELGGLRAKKLACADEATGLEDVVEPWLDTVLSDMVEACLSNRNASDSVKEPKERDEVQLAKALESQSLQELQVPLQSNSAFDASTRVTTEQLSRVTVITNEALHGRGDQSHCSETAIKGVYVGVDLVKASLGLADDSQIPAVAHSLLPSLGASRSSCELFSEEDEHATDKLGNVADNATISTSSSGAILYTESRPYEAKIIGARYLTKTSTAASVRIVDTARQEGTNNLTDYLMARTIFDSEFKFDEVDDLVREQHGKRVIEMLLSLPDDYSLEYQPGDTVGILVPNHPEDVSFVLTCLQEYHGVAPTQKVSIDGGLPITLQKAMTDHVDLSCTLKNKKIINGLSQFATNTEEAAALRLLASRNSAGLKLYQEYIIDQRRSFTDLLRDFPSCRSITMAGILSLLPAIPPRYYSISSSPLDSTKGSCLSIAFSVVDYLTTSWTVNGREAGRRRIHGIATSYLETSCTPFLAGIGANFNFSPMIKIFPKPTADFRLPPSLSTPIVLIGPGTGIAPFMGFLTHRRALLSSSVSHDAANTVVQGTWRGGYELETNDLSLDHKDSEGLGLATGYMGHQAPGKVEVYFGCRHQNHDWLFEKEMKQFVSEGIITNLYTAFSRDGKMQYVQDLMKDEKASQRLLNLVTKENGVVYICGDGNTMARDVQNTLASILTNADDGNHDTNIGRELIEKLKREGRLLLDIWS